MSSTLGHGFNTVKGNLSKQECNALDIHAKRIFGPAELVLYGFRTEGLKLSPMYSETGPGKILFTSHRIIFYYGTHSRGQCLNIYPYSAIVSVVFPIFTSGDILFGSLSSLRFREVDCNQHPRGGERTVIYVKMTSDVDIQHLSAATLCMDRVPSP
jgi:hypothetical protein